jgi:hypothetical protein
MVRKSRDPDGFDSSHKIPRIEAPRTAEDYARVPVGRKDFLDAFAVFLKCPDTPRYESPKKAIQGWKLSRLRYLRERAREEQLSPSQTREAIEEDALLNLLYERPFVVKLTEVFEAFASNRKTSQKKSHGR